MMEHLAPALALGVERLTGYPGLLQKIAGHPVQWMGRTLQWLEQRLYVAGLAPHKMKERGILTLLLLILLFAGPAWIIAWALGHWSFGWIINALLATTLLAQKSLREHVAAVEDGLRQGLPQARTAVSKIVGRDPEQLDQSGIVRAALESLAENTADGIVAPLFWYVVAGLPGIVAYKAINTADSMIGHKSERYLHFGWAAARLDDLVNLPASRLSALLFAVSAMLDHREDGQNAWRAMRRDARNHQSPNAGWPESALAGALNITLGGPRSYDGQTLDLATMGNGRTDLHVDDIGRGLTLYGQTLTLLFALCLVFGVLF